MSDAVSIQSLRTTWPADVEAEDLLRALLRLVRVRRELDPARLAAPAGEHLRLDDDGAAEHLGGLPRLAGSRREPPLRDGDPDPPEELLALVLVEVHPAREAIEDTPPPGAPPPGPRRVCEHGRMQRPVAVLVALGAAPARRGLRISARPPGHPPRRAARRPPSSHGTSAPPRHGPGARLPGASLRGDGAAAGRRTSRSRTGPASPGSSARIPSRSSSRSGSCCSRRDEMGELEQRNRNARPSGTPRGADGSSRSSRPGWTRCEWRGTISAPGHARRRPLGPRRLRPACRSRRPAGRRAQRVHLDHRPHLPAARAALTSGAMTVSSANARR